MHLESSFFISSEVRAFLHERLDVLLDEGGLVAEHAAFGQTLHDLESFYLNSGRNFLRESFEQTVQDCIERTESHAALKECVQCKKTHYRNTQSKGIVTTHGAITISRARRRCPHCKQSAFPVEKPLGLDTSYTKHLKRLVTRCCGFWTFELASRAYSVLVWTQSMAIVILSSVVISVYFHGGHLWPPPIRLTCEHGS